MYMNINIDVMNQLFEVAEESFNNDEIPVAAAIFDSKTNDLIAIAGNNRQMNHNVLGHAEINCILEAEKVINDWRLDGFYMVVTLEPCDMCSIIIKESRLDQVYYLLPKKQLSTVEISINKKLIDGYEEEKEKFNKLLTSFFDNMR